MSAFLNQPRSPPSAPDALSVDFSLASLSKSPPFLSSAMIALASSSVATRMWRACTSSSGGIDLQALLVALLQLLRGDLAGDLAAAARSPAAAWSSTKASRFLNVGIVSSLALLAFAGPPACCRSCGRAAPGKTACSGTLRYCGGRACWADLELGQLDRLAVDRGDHRILGRAAGAAASRAWPAAWRGGRRSAARRCWATTDAGDRDELRTDGRIEAQEARTDGS